MFLKKSIHCFTVSFLVLALLFSMTGALAVSSEPTTGHAIIWQEPIYIENVQAGFLNGQGKNVPSFSYQGTLYMPLRMVGEWMGCQVWWDQETQTVSLTSGSEPYYLNLFTYEAQPGRTEEERQQLILDLANGIEIQISPNITVMLDREKQEFTNAKEEPVYPVVFRESIFLPVRNAGELCGKEVLWMPPIFGRPSMVFIYNAPSEQQIEEIQAYYVSCVGYYYKISAAVDNLVAANDLSADEALEELSALNEMIQDLKNLAHPSAPFFEGYACDRIRHSAWYLEGVVDDFVSIMSGNIATLGGTDWNNQREVFGEIIGLDVSNFWGNMESVYDLMDAAGIGAETP